LLHVPLLVAVRANIGPNVQGGLVFPGQLQFEALLYPRFAGFLQRAVVLAPIVRRNMAGKVPADQAFPVAPEKLDAGQVDPVNDSLAAQCQVSARGEVVKVHEFAVQLRQLRVRPPKFVVLYL
jgi:hypothetical protein